MSMAAMASPAGMTFNAVADRLRELLMGNSNYELAHHYRSPTQPTSSNGQSLSGQRVLVGEHRSHT